MIKIDFKEPDTDEWRAWRAECETEQNAHNQAIQAGKPSKVKPEVYKGVKYNIKSDVYMSPRGQFSGKCTYCESFIAADQPGDIDHFRPKGRVTDSEGNPIAITTKDGEIPHPGYYWLVYDWRNLLPSCIDCNRPSKGKSGGKRIGKWDQFPVAGFRATRPTEETQEDPLLINPVSEIPENHLQLDETGVFSPRNKSPKGQACIDVFGLNVREALVEGRKKAYEDTKAKFKLWLLVPFPLNKFHFF